ncbi:MAG: SDR family NAD(P)-dependent oxidoreductase [Myxococcota bacterium]
MRKRAKATVLITGASTGLGLALAKRLLRSQRYRLVLTARAESLSRFREHGIFGSDEVWIRPLDVRSHAQRVDVVREMELLWGGIDVLVNNAGVAYRAVVEHMEDADRVDQMEINFRAPMELIRLALPGMRRRERGRIVTISSVSGMMAMPTMSVYSASKFALEGAHEALWYEVRPWNVFVTLVRPGFIRSETFRFVRRTELSRQGEADVTNAYHAHYRGMGGFIERVMRRFALQDHDDVAKVVARVMRQRRPPLRVSGTLDAWAFSMLRRLLPRRLYHALLYRNLPSVRQWGPKRLLGRDAQLDRERGLNL